MADTDVHLSPKDIQSLDAARLYYELGLNQEQVAERVHVSRPTVSKLLAHAHRRGFVHIEVLDPREHDELVITRLTERYDLAEVRLVSVPRSLPGQLGAALGAQAADLLASLVRDGDVVAVQASAVMADVVRHLSPAPRRQVRVIQMARVLSDYLIGREEAFSPSMLAAHLHAELTPLPEPLLAASVPEANRLRSASPMREALAAVHDARIAVFSVQPAARLLGLLDRLGLAEADAAILREHAVGEICSHVVDVDGCVCLPDLNNRTLGISLTDLRRIEMKVLVAGGHGMAPVVRAALSNGYVDRLVTDVDTAREVLALEAA